MGSALSACACHGFENCVPVRDQSSVYNGYSMVPGSRHHCLLYDGAPSRHLPAVAAVLCQKLKQNRRCLYLNSPPMVAGLKSRMAADGVDVEGEIASGNLVLNSEQHQSHGDFDIEKMLQMLQSALEAALSNGYDGLFATGDMTWEFGEHRDLSRLLEYEWRLEEFIRQNPRMSGICQYHGDTLPREILRNGLISHSELFINETLSMINPHFLRPNSTAESTAPRIEIDEFIDRILAQVFMNRAAPA